VARSALLCAMALLLVAAVLSGCQPAGPEWVEANATYTASDVKAVFEGTESAPGEGEPVSEAAALRHRALVALRKKGAAAAEAADLITRTFPATAGVPVYVEKATFDDTSEALVVVELIGPEDGALSDQRLWVLSKEGDVLFSSVR